MENLFLVSYDDNPPDRPGIMCSIFRRGSEKGMLEPRVIYTDDEAKILRKILTEQGYLRSLIQMKGQ